MPSLSDIIKAAAASEINDTFYVDSDDLSKATKGTDLPSEATVVDLTEDALFEAQGYEIIPEEIATTVTTTTAALEKVSDYLK